jgi:hypothetical protein
MMQWKGCGQVWWLTAVIPVLGRLRKKDPNFDANLGRRVKLSQEKM